MSTTYAAALEDLRLAQKPAARSAPAYSRFVNRRWGRHLAALAAAAGLGPNQVTGLSALSTGLGVALLALAPLSVATGVGVAVLLALGYALDSADGQLARLLGRGSTAGEWLDHVVDGLDDRWLALPYGSVVVTSVLFFAMILTEQLRRTHQVESRAETGPGARSWVRALLVVPMDYGVLCWSFLLLGVLPVFLAVYALITLASAAFLLLAGVKWYRELAALDAARRSA